MQNRFQEELYKFPYHYIPRVQGGKIIHSISIDYAGLYLRSIQAVVDIIRQYTPKRILDVGCGDGRIINELSKSFGDINFLGIDVSERAIKFAQLYSSTENTKFKVIDICNQKDSEQIGLFDLATLVEVLEHIPVNMCPQFLCKIVSCVKIGGLIHIIVPHKNKKVNKKHFQHFNNHELKKIVSEIGNLSVVETTFLDDNGIMNYLLSRLVNNRCFTIKCLWQKILQKQLVNKAQKEKKCGRISLLLKKTH